MVDDETAGPSPDDILEEERAGRLTARVGNDPLPEDYDPPSANEPDHGDNDEAY